jgi:hypothetical protein
VEVVWTFDVALSLWAVLLFAKKTIAEGGPTLVIDWRAGPRVDAWIARGGGAAIQALDDLARLTAEDVLRHYSKQLETLSWGLSEQYRHILALLQDEMNQ